jgi:transcriptional regulator with XRE-family HTH domain
MPTIGQTIRSARKTKRLSQEALGKLVGVTRVAVSEWERDESLPRVATARKVAAVLDVAPSTLTPLSQDGVKSYHGTGPQDPYVEWDDLPVLARDTDQRSFKLVIEDSAMSPVFNVGDTITVNPSETAWDGCHVIAMTPDGSTGMMRNYRIRPYGGCDLWPFNPEYTTETLIDDGADRIIGLVTAHERQLSRP